MASFDNGILSYVEARATVTVFFPIDSKGREHISCLQCPYFDRKTQKCMLNSAIVAFPEYVGYNCPLERVEKEEGE